MEQGMISSILGESITQIIILSIPLLGIGMIVGLIISIFQATTSIQEQTLTFVPKLLIILLILMIMGPFFYNTFTDYMRHVFDLIGTARM